MNQKIKISQLPAKGSNLAAADLLEIAEFTGTGYISKSITGQEIIDAIPVPSVDWGDIGGTLSAQTDLQSALDAKVPTTRTLTINGVTQDLSADRTFTISTGITIGSTAITSGTVGRVLFQGTGNVVSQSSNLFWDEAATRFQVGTTATSPVGSPLIFMGRDQNAETNFQISNATNGTGAAVGFRILSSNNRASYLYEFAQSFSSITEFASHLVLEPNAPGLKHGFIISLPETTSGSDFMIYTGGRTASNRRLTLFNGTGNLAIGTTTDAGFRLDVNGTARVRGTGTTFATTSFSVVNNANTSALSILDNLSVYFGGEIFGPSNFYINGPTANTGVGHLRFATLNFPGGSATSSVLTANQLLANGEIKSLSSLANVILQNTTTASTWRIENHRVTSGALEFKNDLTNPVLNLFSTRNVGIGTFTDAGFKLDVNGTARVVNSIAVNTGNVNGQGVQIGGDTNGGIFLVSGATQFRQYNYAFEFAGLGTNVIIRTDAARIMTKANYGISLGTYQVSTPEASAILQAFSTTQGFLPPRMTTTQKNAIASPAAGLMVYDTTLNVISYYNGSMWI